MMQVTIEELQRGCSRLDISRLACDFGQMGNGRIEIVERILELLARIYGWRKPIPPTALGGTYSGVTS